MSSEKTQLQSLKEADLALKREISWPPTDAQVQEVINYLYHQCVPASTHITSQYARAEIENIVAGWSHFLRIAKGSPAFVPLAWTEIY